MPGTALSGEEPRGEARQVMGDSHRAFVHVVSPVDQLVAHARDVFARARRVDLYRAGEGLGESFEIHELIGSVVTLFAIWRVAAGKRKAAPVVG